MTLCYGLNIEAKVKLFFEHVLAVGIVIFFILLLFLAIGTKLITDNLELFKSNVNFVTRLRNVDEYFIVLRLDYFHLLLENMHVLLQVDDEYL